jgi:hypothetical protein
MYFFVVHWFHSSLPYLRILIACIIGWKFDHYYDKSEMDYHFLEIFLCLSFILFYYVLIEKCKWIICSMWNTNNDIFVIYVYEGISAIEISHTHPFEANVLNCLTWLLQRTYMKPYSYRGCCNFCFFSFGRKGFLFNLHRFV